MGVESCLFVIFLLSYGTSWDPDFLNAQLLKSEDGLFFYFFIIGHNSSSEPIKAKISSRKGHWGITDAG